MSLLWPHRVRVEAPGDGTAGSFNEEDEWVPDPDESPDVLYEGAANVLDRGRVLKRAEDGTPVETSDATCYVKKKRLVGHIPTGSIVHVDWRDGTQSDALVVGTNRSDNSLDLRRL